MMEEMSAESEPQVEPVKARPPLNLFNILAIVFLALSCLSAAFVGVVLASPGLVPAAFRPPTLPAVALRPTLPPESATPTATNTPAAPTLPPEWTDTPTPTVTNTPPPSGTPTTTPTETPRGPTRTPAPTFTRTPTPTRTPSPTPTGPTRSPFAYTLQNGSPAYLSNFANTAGCNWQGIAGQVFNLQGQPQIGLLVHLEGGGLNLDVLTGSKPEYGQAGYEFFLTNVPKQTIDVFRVQLRNTAGAPLSDVYIIPTFANSGNTCPKNLALVNFVQNH